MGCVASALGLRLAGKGTVARPVLPRLIEKSCNPLYNARQLTEDRSDGSAHHGS